MSTNTYYDLIKKAKYIETSYGHGAFGEGEIYRDEKISCEKLIDATYHECLEMINEKLAKVELDDVHDNSVMRKTLHALKRDIRKRIERQ